MTDTTAPLELADKKQNSPAVDSTKAGRVAGWKGQLNSLDVGNHTPRLGVGKPTEMEQSLHPAPGNGGGLFSGSLGLEKRNHEHDDDSGYQ